MRVRVVRNAVGADDAQRVRHDPAHVLLVRLDSAAGAAADPGTVVGAVGAAGMTTLAPVAYAEVVQAVEATTPARP